MWFGSSASPCSCGLSLPSLYSWPSSCRRDQLTVVTNPPYRLGLLFITSVAIPFAFVDQPQIIIRTFTIVGSLFAPFIAGTL